MLAGSQISETSAAADAHIKMHSCHCYHLDISALLSIQEMSLYSLQVCFLIGCIQLTSL